MDGIYFLVLLAFGALTGALLALCAALGDNPPASRGNGEAAAADSRPAADNRGQ